VVLAVPAARRDTALEAEIPRDSTSAPLGVDELDVQPVARVHEGDPLVLEGFPGLRRRDGSQPKVSRRTISAATDSQRKQRWCRQRPRWVNAWTGDVGSVGSMSFTGSDPRRPRNTTRTFSRVLTTISVSGSYPKTACQCSIARAIDRTAIPTSSMTIAPAFRPRLSRRPPRPACEPRRSRSGRSFRGSPGSSRGPRRGWRTRLR
jgi:hypothetical protein